MIYGRLERAPSQAAEPTLRSAENSKQSVKVARLGRFLARAISPTAAAISAGSPSSNAASRYAARSASEAKCSAGSHGFVFVLGIDLS